MSPLQRHKNRIRATIKANATRNEIRVFKPRHKWKRHYGRRRHRFDTYAVGETP